VKRCSRRAALTALGAGAALTLGRKTPQARAGSAGARCFIGIYMPHGMASELWRPRGDFVLDFEDSSLAPLAPFREHVLTLEGLDLSAGIAASTTGHDASRVILTGSASNGRNPSIDQSLALEHGLGAETPLSSLVLGVGNDGLELGSCISYAAGGSALPKLIDPSKTFAAAFGHWLTGGDPAALARAEHERRLGRSLLDYWSRDLAALRARAPARESAKLEQHATALRELEKRLTGAELTCPPAPVPEPFPKLRAYQGGEPYFDAITDWQIDLLCHALSCGVTRFATLFLADLSRTGVDPTLPEDVHIDVAHRYRADLPESWTALARQNRSSYSKLARVLERLSEYELLDDSVIVAMSDMGDPQRHSSRQVPTVLAGGWGGALKGGRHLDLGREGTPNNRLLVSVQRAFGVDRDTFGDSADPSLLQGSLSLS
jgi:hypothetical protein